MTDLDRESTIAEALTAHIQSSPLPAVGLDRDGRIVAMSGAYRRLVARADTIRTAQDVACHGCGTLDHLRLIVSMTDRVENPTTPVHSVIVCNPTPLDVRFDASANPWIVSLRWTPDGRLIRAEGLTGPEWDGRVGTGFDLFRLVDDSLAAATTLGLKALTPRQPSFTGRGRVRYPGGRPAWIVHHTTASFEGDRVAELHSIVFNVLSVVGRDGSAVDDVLRALCVWRHEDTSIVAPDGTVLWSSASTRDHLDDPAIETQLRWGLPLPDDHADLDDFVVDLASGPPWRERHTIIQYRGEGRLRQTYRLVGIRAERPGGGEAIVLLSEHVTGDRVQAMLEFEEELRSLMSETEEFVLLIDESRRLRFGSDRFIGRVDISIGDPLTNVIDRQDLAAFDELISEALEAYGRRAMARLRFREPGRDEALWVDVTAKHIPEDEAVSGIVLTGRTVTQPKTHLTVVASGRARGGNHVAELAAQIRELSVLDRARLLAALAADDDA